MDSALPEDDQAAPYGYEADGITPRAPYGVKDDGTPKRSAGGRPPGSGRGRRTRSTTRTTKPKAPSRKTAPRPRASTPDYRAGVCGLLSVVALPIRFAGPAGPLDAATLMLHADEIGTACQETAQADARFAAALDKAMSVGPYGALIGCALRLGAQLAENHGLLPTQITTAMGAMPRDELLAQLEGHVGDQPQPAAA